MNSTSFCESGGSFAVVEDGSFRLGWPGAPGWTTTGGGCCARATEQKGRRSPPARANARADKNLRWREKPWKGQFGTLLNIFIQRSMKDCIGKPSVSAIFTGHTGSWSDAGWRFNLEWKNRPLKAFYTED
jgi:hypothetical protein